MFAFIFITNEDRRVSENNNLNAKNAEILFSRLKELRKNNTINYRDYFDDRKLENLLMKPMMILNMIY